MKNKQEKDSTLWIHSHNIWRDALNFYFNKTCLTFKKVYFI